MTRGIYQPPFAGLVQWVIIAALEARLLRLDEDSTNAFLVLQLILKFRRNEFLVIFAPQPSES